MKSVHKFLLAFILFFPWTSAPRASESSPEIIKSSHVIIKRNHRVSRDSAVKVRSFDGGHGSGSYVKIDEHYLIITAAHVVRSGFVFAIDGERNETVLGQVVYRSTNLDIAALKVPRMISRKPINIRPASSEEMVVGTWFVYTGFPSSYDSLTSSGIVSGTEENSQAILLQGFAWPGSSGSGVVDSSGNLRAILFAVGVEHYDGAQLLETLVYVHPISRTELSAIKESLKPQ